jgi:hypothetical protein
VESLKKKNMSSFKRWKQVLLPWHKIELVRRFNGKFWLIPLGRQCHPMIYFPYTMSVFFSSNLHIPRLIILVTHISDISTWAHRNTCNIQHFLLRLPIWFEVWIQKVYSEFNTVYTFKSNLSSAFFSNNCNWTYMPHTTLKKVVQDRVVN